MSDSLQPHGLYSPWNSPGQHTGVGSLSLLQGIFPTQELNQGLLHCRRILYQLSYALLWFIKCFHIHYVTPPCFITPLPLWGRQIGTHSFTGELAGNDKTFCVSSCARCWKHVHKRRQKGKPRLRKMMWYFLGVQSYPAGKLDPRASFAMWLFPCLHTPHRPFLHTEIQKDDISPASFLLLIYILLNDEIIQYIIPQQLCCLKKKLGME